MSNAGSNEAIIVVVSSVSAEDVPNVSGDSSVAVAIESRLETVDAETLTRPIDASFFNSDLGDDTLYCPWSALQSSRRDGTIQ